MTKLEYLERLHTELNRLNVRDVDDITAEYEQHFAFKLADGFSEEEISAKLGTPAAIAAQFAADGGAAKKSPGKKAFLAVWLTLLGFLEALLDMTFFAFIIGIFAAAVACGAIGVCLIGRLNIAGCCRPCRMRARFCSAFVSWRWRYCFFSPRITVLRI
jgi:uncharacterized membrane protein